jgi:hypothetical protein
MVLLSVEPITQASRQHSPYNRAFTVPLLFLPIFFFAGWYYIGRSAGWQQNLKAFEAKAERSKSWLRDRAIGKLPLYSDGGGVLDEANAAAKEWASRSARNDFGNSTVIDVITVGTVNSLGHMHKQQKTWASSDQSVRNVFIATEITTDDAIVASLNGSCRELMKSCDVSRNNGRRGLASSSTTKVEKVTPNAVSPHLDSGQCLDRRLGLAMGASVGRYRKIIKALVNFGGSGADLMSKQYTSQTLPDYLIITYESAYYNTQRLVECMGRDSVDTPIVYAPFVSWTDVNLSDKTRKKKKQSSKSSISFAYPTRKAGVVFNKAAMEIWVRIITCFEPNDFSTLIHYDAETHAIEHDFCWLMMMNRNATASRRYDAFESVIRETIKISLFAQRGGRTNHRNEFHLSSMQQAVSIGDLLSMYASTLHLLCKSSSVTDPGRLPSVEKMFGYLIHRFGLVGNGEIFGDETNSSCKSSYTDECNPRDMVACANISSAR